MKTITINNKQYPMHITLGAMVRFKAATGKDVSQISDDITEVAMFMYCAVKAASAAAGVEFDLEFEPFCDCMTIEDISNFQGAEKKTVPKPKTA